MRKKNRFVEWVFVVACILSTSNLSVHAQSIPDDMGARITLPTFQARLSLGFNYDLLKSPTDVSFEYPVGYFGLNIPLNQNINLREIAGRFDPLSDTIFADTSLFRNGEDFQPQGIARQNPNSTVRVEVPMLGGVGCFAYTQNFFLNYQTVLGNPSIFISPDDLPAGVQFVLRGTINVPLDLTLGWETMTFGYAYQLQRNIIFAFSLHRHLFNVDLRGRVDVDLLGAYNIQLDSDPSLSDMLTPIYGELDYPSEKINGYVLGNYKAEVWSPTLGVKLWRFSLSSRFGVKTNAPGSIDAKYYVPSFIDPETFRLKYDLNNPDVFMDPEVREELLSNAVDSVGYSTDSKLHWRLPHGHTLQVDLWPGIFSLSYTKMFGDIELKLDNIRKEQKALNSPREEDGLIDSLGFDLGISVDHMMMLHCSYRGTFLNVGIFGFDLRHGERENILGEKMLPELRLGKAAMMPILNLGAAMGSKLKLLVELDILPLPAFKSGVFYHF